MEKRTENWFNHFKDLLGEEPNIEGEEEEISPIFTDVNVEEGPFTMIEFLKIKRDLSERKSAGEDGIVVEVIKRCNFDEVILEFCNKALDNQKPEQWGITNIVPLPKSGDLKLAKNYRGISLSSIVAKIFNKLLLNRIKKAIDNRLRINQNGFRSQRSTVSQILSIRRLIEGVREKNQPAVLTFIDFRKAFDSIHRGKMLKILTTYGMPDRIVNAIKSTYTNTYAKVIGNPEELMRKQ